MKSCLQNEVTISEGGWLQPPHKTQSEIVILSGVSRSLIARDVVEGFALALRGC
jgi:hypothetical protein